MLALVFGIALTAAGAAAAAGAVDTAPMDPFLRCELLLNSDWARANQAEVARLYAEDDATEDLVYVGISSRELIELMNRGVVEAGKTRLWPRVVRGSPTLREFLSHHSSYEHDAAESSAQVKLAREDAWVRTVADVVAARQPRGDLAGDKVQSFLRRLDQGFRAGKPYSPSFTRLRELAEASDLSPVGTTKKLRRTRGLCSLVNVAWPRNLEAGMGSLERDLTAAFANLPAAGGVVLSFNPSVLKRITWSQHAPPHLPRFELSDLAGVDPNCEESLRFLDRLAPTL